MGARASFIQAMLIGVVVGAALTTAYFQLRDDDRLSVDAKRVECPPPQQPLECDARCCRFVIDEATKDAHWTAIEASLGTGLAIAKAGGVYQITKCW